MQNSTIGIGLLSVGWMGRVHSQAYRRVGYHYPDLPVRPRLVAAADVVADRGRLAVDELGYAEWTDDWRAVVANPAVAAVSIAAPNHLHHAMALAAARHGKHFWIEKPVGRDVTETADIAKAAADAGLRTAVGFNYRHAPAVAHARNLVRDGRLGRITHVRGRFLNDYAADPRTASSWRFERALAGSGALGDLMSHTVDLLHYVVGPVTEVSALTSTVITARPGAGGDEVAVGNEDYAGALLRFADGAVGVGEASRVTVGPRCDLGFDIHGTDGAVSWNSERLGELRVCLGRSGPNQGYTTVLVGPEHGDYARFQPGPAIAMGYDDLKVIEAAQFLRSIVTDTQVAASTVDALAAAEVLAAMERAAASRRWEQVR
ncbi:MAG TPA: Gfo/Idh/MocA family oxidoreductase [Planosporangium sp.]|nr:Gfo/Idh/MocA family oxidoreductase [Planosporangium sp.]